MIIGIQDEILKIHSLGLLGKLLCDKTTGTHILWATDAYADFGKEYERDKEIELSLITGGNSGIIKNRARKALEQQTERTRRHAEVFTPLWICKRMNDYADEVWFGRMGVFFDEEGSPTENILFPQTRRKTPEWQRYVDSRRLEITCGEAPYLVSRYDVSTGEYIEIRNRIGILDRKLRVVNENAKDEDEWHTWAIRAFQSTYGYEFQGDNLLIARVNLLMTYEEYLHDRWKRKPTAKEYQEIIRIIVWNIWQMDGLSGTIPYCKAPEVYHQMDLFEWLGSEDYQEEVSRQPHCRINNWRQKDSLEYLDLSEGGKKNMKFDFVIGNPPYQDETVGEQKNYAAPIYHMFLSAAYQVSDRVEMIHPARFLFNAGSTPKDWNDKMLHDKHFKVLKYWASSGEVFANTDIKGGVAITYHDTTKDYGEIGHFVVFDELRSIMSKAISAENERLSNLVYAPESYKFTDMMHEDYPNVEAMLSKGHKYDFKTNVVEKLDGIVFYRTKPEDGHEYVRVLGLEKGKRIFKWIRRDYIKEAENFEKYKIFIPEANGSGALGEVLSTPLIGQPLIGQPLIGHTQTFISMGCLDSQEEADALLKYVKTKFCRTMLGTLKITQHNARSTWRNVPLQDFTPSSDIDWSKSIADIDRQLYAKYGLDEKEIAFIESHVKEMA